MGYGGGRERDREVQGCQTKPRWHQFISASPPSSVTFVIGIYGVTTRALESYIELEFMVLQLEYFMWEVILLYRELYQVILS